MSRSFHVSSDHAGTLLNIAEFATEALAGDANHAPDLMPHQNMLYAYRAYYDATGDKRVLDLMTRYFHWELTLDDKRFFNGGWGAARNSVCAHQNQS